MLDDGPDKSRAEYCLENIDESNGAAEKNDEISKVLQINEQQPIAKAEEIADGHGECCPADRTDEVIPAEFLEVVLERPGHNLGGKGKGECEFSYKDRLTTVKIEIMLNPLDYLPAIFFGPNPFIDGLGPAIITDRIPDKTINRMAKSKSRQSWQKSNTMSRN